ncbi:hypothetical protein NQ318_013121 [Aromia moschata]|uniref:Reverse transcriptase domain-containing protein n=1 Tax=Aromia moschata TaxID=1265417 RepID=A0AAV8X4S9_9CUCU|nr:hypothetical protein NQ318_013121 [Aromia moschata]
MRERQWKQKINSGISRNYIIINPKRETRVWFRYADDIFAVFDTKSISLDNFVAKLNNRFPTIKFTY